MSSNKITSVVLVALVFSSARGATIPSAVDLDTCIDLCSSCDGIAEYKDGQCECSISTNRDDGTECVSRMKRQAQEIGLDVVSCDTSEDTRSTRCCVGSRHAYGKNDIDQVAKYFMQDGPVTGSIFIAPPYTHQAVPLISQPIVAQAPPIVGKSADCGLVGSPKSVMTQPDDINVGAPNLITQPKEFMPADVSTADVAASPTTLTAPQLGSLTIQRLAPQFLSFLGEVITKPLVGLPAVIQSVSQTPGVNQLVGAPANFLNSLADQMAERDKIAKENLENFREVVSKAEDDVKVGLENLAESSKDVLKPIEPPVVGATMTSQPSYSIMNPHPMLNWMNPTVGAAAPMHFVGSPHHMQLVGSPPQMQIVGSPAQMQIVGSPAQMHHLMGGPLMNAAQLVQNQMVGAPAAGSSDCGQSHMLGSPSPSFNSPQQMVGAAGSPSITVPVIQSLGTIPLSSIVSHMPPTYLVGSPMTYYHPSMQTAGDNHVESLEEVPLSSPPQKKICKKSVRDQPAMKYTRDVKAVEDHKELLEERLEMTTTTTTEVPMIDRTTTHKPKEKSREDKSFIGKIKSSGKNKGEKKL